MRYPLLCLSLLASFLIVNIQANATACYGDYTPPVAVCDAHTVVALGADGVATVYAYNLDDGSYDNCGIDHFEAARMWPGWCPYGVVADTQFRPYVQFCCEDVGTSVWVIMRVFDAHGNYNDCMVEVTVQMGPSSLHCPYNKTVYCDYWFDWNDLYDPWNTFFGWPTTGGGCNNPNVTVEVIDHRTCGVGHIKRIFSTGGGGYGGYGGNSCVQYIYFVDNHPFTGYDIHWPYHYEANGCDMINADPHYLPSGYGFPTWNNTSCSLIGYNYEDQIFEFVDGVCTKILRTWTIIDWCQFDPHHPYYGGIWTYLQVIKLVDHSKPQFENCVDVTVNGLESNCKGRFEHHPQVWDECTPLDRITLDYKIDIYANGSQDIIKHGHPYIDEILPMGKHKVLWFADDGCGNTNSCWFYVTVVDKKPPTPVCYANLSTVVMPQGGMVTIWARDFNASSYDNCTQANQLKFSFSSNVLEASHTFICDDVGLVPLKIYVTDLAGNQAYCNTFITLTDNGPVCPDMNTLTGTVEMFTAEAVSGAEAALYKVKADGSMEMDMMNVSGSDGSYKVGFGTTQFDRMLDVTKESEALAGVTTLDLVYLQQHILGIAPLTHPAALEAADVDGSGRAGVNDLLMLRDAFLSGGKSLHGANLPWEFYPADCDWTNGEPSCQFSVAINHNSPPVDPLDFVGYKLGDINGDIMQDPSQRSAYHFPIGVRYDQSAGAYAFVAMDDAEVLGMQISLGSRSGLKGSAGFTGGALNMSDQNCYVDLDSRVVNMSWVSPALSYISKGQTLFYLPSADIQGQKLSIEKGAFRNEVYFSDRVPVRIDLVMLDGLQPGDYPISAVSGLEQESDGILTQRSFGVNGFADTEPFFAPNPMIETGSLYFRLSDNQEANLEVFSADQKIVVSRKIEALRGLNEIAVSSDELGLPGVFLYKLTVGDRTFTGKIISVD